MTADIYPDPKDPEDDEKQIKVWSFVVMLAIAILLGILFIVDVCGMIRQVKRNEAVKIHPEMLSYLPDVEYTDTIVFSPYFCMGYWDTDEDDVKIITYNTMQGELDVIVSGESAQDLVEDVFRYNLYLVTVVDEEGNHYAIDVIRDIVEHPMFDNLQLNKAKKRMYENDDGSPKVAM